MLEIKFKIMKIKNMLIYIISLGPEKKKFKGETE